LLSDDGRREAGRASVTVGPLAAMSKQLSSPVRRSCGFHALHQCMGGQAVSVSKCKHCHQHDESPEWEYQRPQTPTAAVF